MFFFYLTLFLLADVIERTLVDTIDANFNQAWTMVYKIPYTINGRIKRIHVFSANENVHIKFGVFRPDAGVECRFELVQEFVATSVPLGVTTVYIMQYLSDNCFVTYKAQKLLLLDQPGPVRADASKGRRPLRIRRVPGNWRHKIRLHYRTKLLREFGKKSNSAQF